MLAKMLCFLSCLALAFSSCAHQRTFTPIGNCRFENGQATHCVDASNKDRAAPTEGVVFDLQEFLKFDKECHE